MTKLSAACQAWGTPAFERILKDAIEQMDVALLPLQQALLHSSYTDGANRSVRIIGVSEDAGLIRATIGIFYTGIIAGCHCADDPTPANEISEYCELQLAIDKITATATFTLLAETPS